MLTTQKYSSGDIVKITSACDSYGQLGKIIRYCDGYSNNVVVVRLENGATNNYNERSLELVQNITEEKNMALTGNFKIAKVNFVQGYNTRKEYAFALFDDGIKEGDIVLCDSDNGYGVAKVTDIMSQDEYGKPVTKEIICACDFAPFEKRKAVRKQMVEIKKKLDKAVRENQDLFLYKTIAQNNPDVAKLLAEYESLLAE